MPESWWDEIQIAAENENVSAGEWMRRALRERLDRCNNPVPDISDDELDSRIEAVLTRMIEEKKRKQ